AFRATLKTGGPGPKARGESNREWWERRGIDTGLGSALRARTCAVRGRCGAAAQALRFRRPAAAADTDGQRGRRSRARAARGRQARGGCRLARAGGRALPREL